jgi:catechol 2,3-dioxygenase-like lactoylglutathione lyase family enzyme
MVMVDHVSIPVADLDTASRFYDPVLATLGLRRRKQRDGAIGYGPDDVAPPIFWILTRQAEGSASAGVGLHISFRTDSRERVHRFYDTALAHGGTDAGAPGERPQYTAGFYGCFVFDLDGFKIEAVVREGLHEG